MLARGSPLRRWSSVGKIITVCNVLLALYNFMCFSVFRGHTEPCVVVLNNSQLQHAAENGLVKESELAPEPLKQKTVLESSATLTQEFRGDFVVLPNYIRARGAPPDFNKSVTYTTQATPDFFFPHVTELCNRWGGPISLAVYAPGSDLAVVNSMLAHQVRCDPCTAQNVSFHIVYHGKHTPPNIPNDPEQYIASLKYDCEKPPHDDSSYRKLANLTYPINVLRNVARLRAETKYVLASDIELYPSANIIPRFIKLMESAPMSRGVYPLPVFEVEKGQAVPRTKADLQQLYADRRAIFFHWYVCDKCHSFPERHRWIHQNETNSTALGVFVTTKRRKDRSFWEPFYIGTNEEPLYPEELTWEGKRNKMPQIFEMCLMDYDFRILNDAFLCHAPGIKENILRDMWRSPHMRWTDEFYSSILSRITNKHSNGLEAEKCLSTEAGLVT